MSESTQDPVAELLDRANAAYERADLKAASQHYREVLQLDPTQAMAHSRLGAILAQAGDLDAAEASLRRALELEPHLAPALSNLGNVHFTRGEYQEALELYLQAARIDPDNAVFQQNLHAAYKRLGQLDRAVSALKKARRLEQAQHREQAREQMKRTRARLGCGTALLLVLAGTLALAVLGAQ